MNMLMKLYLLKLKGTIRNMFSKPSSAIFTVLMLLLYGGLIYISLINPDIALSMGNVQDISAAIFLNIGFSALLVTTMLLQKKMSLFTEDEAFYLFTGPFKRSAIMQYVMVGVVLSAFLFGAINVLMLVLMNKGIAFDAMFLLLCFISQCLLYFFFLVTLYYGYLLSLQNPKMKLLTRWLLGAVALFVLLLFGIVFFQHDGNLSESFSSFIASDIFHFVPMFGWVKMVLISYVAKDMAMLCLGLVLLVASCGVIFCLMSSYKADFVEDVMQDAQDFSKRYKAVKEGRADSMNERKVRTIQYTFAGGAKAIFSKNLLVMKKTNDFLRLQDLLSVFIYLVIAAVMGLGFGFYCYMLILWLFMVLQNSDFMRDMNNYQVYLIPDKPLKKLIYTLLPTLLKLFIELTASIVIGAIVLQTDWKEALQYFVILSGYMVLFMSTTVLSLKVLRSRKTPLMENMLRMLLMVVAAIPSIAIILFFMMRNELTTTLMNWMTVYNLLINFVIAGIILFVCRNMMNGREISSD